MTKSFVLFFLFISINSFSSDFIFGVKAKEFISKSEIKRIHLFSNPVGNRDGDCRLTFEFDFSDSGSKCFMDSFYFKNEDNCDVFDRLSFEKEIVVTRQQSGYMTWHERKIEITVSEFDKGNVISNNAYVEYKCWIQPN